MNQRLLVRLSRQNPCFFVVEFDFTDAYRTITLIDNSNNVVSLKFAIHLHYPHRQKAMSRIAQKCIFGTLIYRNAALCKIT